jgi:hypothetical protein
MPDTLDDLSQQYQNPQLWNLPESGLPPASPTPDWYTRAVEHQQRWPSPGAASIGSTLGEFATNKVYDFNQMIGDAMMGARDPDEAEGARIARLAFMTMGGGAMGAEKGALGMGIRAEPIAGRPGSFDIFGHNDERLGWISPRYDPVSKRVYIANYGSYSDPNLPAGSRALALNRKPWTFGKTPMEALSNQLSMLQLAKDEFPEAETVFGNRISGATKVDRPKPLPAQTTYEKIPKTPEFLELERELGRIARQNIEEHGRSPPASPSPRSIDEALRQRAPQGPSIEDALRQRVPRRRDATSDEIMARYERERATAPAPMPDMSWWGRRQPTEAEQQWINQNPGAYLDWVRGSAPEPPPPNTIENLLRSLLNR